MITGNFPNILTSLGMVCCILKCSFVLETQSSLGEHLGQPSTLTPYPKDQTSICQCYQSINNITSVGINLKPKHPFIEKD